MSLFTVKKVQSQSEISAYTGMTHSVRIVPKERTMYAM